MLTLQFRGLQAGDRAGEKDDEANRPEARSTRQEAVREPQRRVPHRCRAACNPAAGPGRRTSDLRCDSWARPGRCRTSGTRAASSICGRCSCFSPGRCPSCRGAASASTSPSCRGAASASPAATAAPSRRRPGATRCNSTRCGDAGSASCASRGESGRSHQPLTKPSGLDGARMAKEAMCPSMPLPSGGPGCDQTNTRRHPSCSRCLETLPPNSQKHHAPWASTGGPRRKVEEESKQGETPNAGVRVVTSHRTVSYLGALDMGG